MGRQIGQFKCNNGLRVDFNQTCDTFDDCGDLSDEANCKGTKM